MKGMLKRLAKWLVQHGLDEIQKEVDRKLQEKELPDVPR